ncbi:CRISPR-associated endonuclease Cas1 [Candidatus Synechococcus calcipolaris G9]|uniref:CRISPR-associated endonuclease Cas1 n=1 Tax=Candidatus Synechococcus calcipolaris G9 TaxID=1497997 RepID=A0ABT6EZW3_9SYNE|nr:CRISPR-associated endonuclease Cas1 [Candidatus Synechococcus calcipolaris]MDG2991063.1 CRISPR-associated endonuclease Cas1 [Candidatus Synechococcus calcipolaris G9]
MTTTLYLNRQGCSVSLKQEKIIVKYKGDICQECQLQLIDLILVFGSVQLTTQVIRACLKRGVTISYLSQSGYCYGRLLPISKRKNSLQTYQNRLTDTQKLTVARQLIHAKLHNSRVILMRQYRRRPQPTIQNAIDHLHLATQRSLNAQDLSELTGIEGAAAHRYFEALGACFQHPDLTFGGRSRRPPGNEINALLSFGYQILWNHLFGLLDTCGFDAHQGCLHQNHHGHPALVSDILEPFRAPIIKKTICEFIPSLAIPNPIF